jgi:hypothetical protein
MENPRVPINAASAVQNPILQARGLFKSGVPTGECETIEPELLLQASVQQDPRVLSPALLDASFA